MTNNNNPDDVKKTLHTNDKTIDTFKKVIGDLVCLKSEVRKMNYLVGETDFTECMDRRIMTILYDVRTEIDRLEKTKDER